MDPLISVVVPAFNHQNLVEEALASVLDQSWPEIELLVVDDASTDGTADLVEAFLERPETRERLSGRQWLHRQPANAGAHAAINLGVSRASGEWIAVLNSDDRYAPDRLSRMMGELVAGGGQLGFSGVRFIDVSEIAVHGIQVGRAHAVISGPRRIRLGRTVTFTSRSSSGVGRSPIVRRSWSRAGARTRHSTRYRLHATRLGTIRLKLTVTDFRGRKGTVTKVIRVVP